ncbi:argininosuccinate lyase [Aliifodinibius salipaludis]|uniref:Argininosuccinate lyase n=1 Tax=Fodinibius salipaludis TaxID=2032627 RepID=A0A2A2G9S1_9BACT|nr:argininosuccinate lyase [Aliifodinibius salipaludis]PAU93603.1 argininosuccinate lyase [Aliifodinibius salipaludis]
MKLWEKDETSTSKIIDHFTVGNDRILDLEIAGYDLQASKAHAKMLNHVKLLTDQEWNQIEQELNRLLEQVKEGGFTIEEKFEDVHSKIEYELTQALGETGKKIHAGRSRNDQVLVCLHLYVKDQIDAIKDLIRALFDRLIDLSEKHKEIIIPGYTHMQVAMPSSFGLWFGSYAESLIDDLHMLNAAHEVADQNPLGSAAGYGSSLPLNRQMTTELLGFSTIKYNSVAAQMNRGRLEKLMSFGLSAVAGTLSKMAMDICQYTSQNFGFISFPNELTTGSSIMPHKKNPDVFELVRAKCNSIQNLPNQLTMIINNLPSGYHRDFQLLKEKLFPEVQTLKSCLRISEFMLRHIEVNDDIMKEEKYKYIYSVEEVNKKVLEGIPFREAYQRVAKSIEEGHFQPDRNLNHTHEGSIGNLCIDKIREKFANVV